MSVYARDNPHLFNKALQSIFNSTYKPNALVLVIDGPIGDELESIVTLHEQQGLIKVLRCPVNEGLAAALNYGLQHVKTDWVARADADDINVPSRFEKTFDHIASHSDVDIVSGNILEVDIQGHPIAERRLPEHHSEIRSFALTRNPFNHMATCFRRNLALRCGGYPNVHLKEDYALWCRMFQMGAKAHNLQDILVHATAGRDMYKRRGGWKYAKAEFEMQSVLIETGLKTVPRAVIDGFLRALVYLMPNVLRAWIYEKLLRSKTQSHAK